MYFSDFYSVYLSYPNTATGTAATAPVVYNASASTGYFCTVSCIEDVLFGMAFLSE